MTANNRGEVRRSQLITTYGVGAIVALKDESYVVVGIDHWGVSRPNLHEPRLERALSVEGFVTPPATDDGDDIPVRRFPRWVFCPACKRLNEHRFFCAPHRNECPKCAEQLVPSRFVICCSDGHLDDFPYFAWVHAGHAKREGVRHEMSIESAGRTASLRDIRIVCSCGLDRSMEGAFRESALGHTQCRGGRPWLDEGEEGCSQTPRALQRGASNVWFSIVQSALSIPPWSEGAFKVINRHWPVLRHIQVDLARAIEGLGLAADSAFSVSDLVEAVEERRREPSGDGPAVGARLRRQEHQALTRGRPESGGNQDFVCLPAEMSAEASKWFSQIMLVSRLREVRALQSFSRLSPPSGASRGELPPLFDADPGWLPAIEVRGEGVFMEFDPTLIDEWEREPAVVRRVAQLDRNYRRRCEQNGAEPDRVIRPRFVLAHSFAHALINQWALDSGYPSAALRERLYIDDDMAGVLIYTATSDSAGSLGGIVAQAEPSRFDANLACAVNAASWCSADPLCMEADAAGVDALNLAACHSCMLLPEVSCEERNVLLDRALLIGVPGQPEVGFFSSLK